jgi:hypothetical protein
MAETASNPYDYSQGQGQHSSQPEEGGSTVDQAKMKAGEIKYEATEKMRSQADKGTTQAGEKVLSTAEDLHSVSAALHEQGRDSTAQVVDQVAAQAERFANYLRHNSGDTILRDAQDYARRQPWLTAIGGLALGFVAARMVKASGADSRSSQHTQYGSSGMGQPYGSQTYGSQTYGSQTYGSPGTGSGYTSAPGYEPVDPAMAGQSGSRLTVVPGESTPTDETFESERPAKSGSGYDTNLKDEDEYGKQMRDDVSDDLRSGEAGRGNRPI